MQRCPRCSSVHSEDSLCANCSYIDFGLDKPTVLAKAMSIKSVPYKEMQANEKRNKMDHFYMDIAVLSAQNSHAKRLKVGAVLVKDGNIISFGWNGMPAGMDNCCEIDADTTKDEVIHAEINVLGKLARTGGNADGSTMYITDSMCFPCCKMIIASGITRVVYKKKYRIIEPIKFLEDAGVLVEQLG